MPRRQPAKDLKVLWGLSQGRCAFPGCRRRLIEEATDADPVAVIGKIAHIEAHSDRGPRANPRLTEEDRDRYENWILLCGTHHDIVDSQPNSYTPADLRRWKVEHEQWVHDCTREAMPDVSFDELAVVTKAVLASERPASTNFAVTPPQQKMDRNQLTKGVAFELTLGLAKAREVQQFVDHVTSMDQTFPQRLVAGFVAEYGRLREEGLEGDSLFEAMRDFAAQRSRDFKIQAAGLAVLAYLFEKCEVFEK